MVLMIVKKNLVKNGIKDRRDQGKRKNKRCRKEGDKRKAGMLTCYSLVCYPAQGEGENGYERK